MDAYPYDGRWRSAGTPMPSSILTAPMHLPSSRFPLEDQGIVRWRKIPLGRIVRWVFATAGRAISFRIVTAPRLGYASPMENGLRQNSDWIVDLSACDDAQEAALEDLRKLLISGLARSFPQQGAAFIEDTAQVTLLRVLKNLNSFAGKSKFTCAKANGGICLWTK